jgi:3-hydroxyacyl-CoA dehydrogenase
MGAVMSQLVTCTSEGRVAVVTIDNPPVSAFSYAVRDALGEQMARADEDPGVDAIVLTATGRTFVAGADIREFEKLTSGQMERKSAHPLLNAIEDSRKPVVVAIHGTAFGAGLELAMAGHYRIAVRSASVGQPEVKLGLIPGAAGTQRLPRLAGAKVAAEMCAFGDPVDATTALQHGILDRVVDEDLRAAAVLLAREAAGRAFRKARERADKLGDPAAQASMFAELRSVVARRMPGQQAPLAALEAVESATRLPFDEGCRREAELFVRCLESVQSKALIHVFFGERTVAKIPGLAGDTATLPIRRAAIIGAGTMGGGIAMAYANAGIPVALKDVEQAALDRGLETIRKNYQTSVAKGRFTPDEMQRRLSLIEGTLGDAPIASADIVVEAVFENMALKRRLFAELDRVSRPEAILASNTSYLDIDALAAETTRPERVIGHHFFSPANVMRLLEIVRGKATSASVIATSMELARRLRKIGVLVGNARGFVGNRMYEPYVRESVFLVEEGTPPTIVDRAMTGFGMAMGPLSVQDLSGLDVGWRIRKEFAHLRVAGARYTFANDMLCEMGRLGQKSGAGWYRYDENRKRLEDPEVPGLVRERALAAGIEQRAASAEEVVDRLVLALVNEGARVLEEGIALRSVDIDIVYVNGYGFPAWRGGPMKYADLVGLGEVAARVRRLHERFGHHWRPAGLLERLAREGRSFSDFDRQAAPVA